MSSAEPWSADMPGNAERASPRGEPARNAQTPAKGSDVLSVHRTYDSAPTLVQQPEILRCGVCGHAAFPVGSKRLNGVLILASYALSCCHVRPLMLVTGKPRPQDHELALYLPGRRCAACNRRGLPCRSYARPGSATCLAHPAASTDDGAGR